MNRHFNIVHNSVTVLASFASVGVHLLKRLMRRVMASAHNFQVPNYDVTYRRCE